MTRADVYLMVISEKTGEPPERMVLALESIKKRLNDDLDDELDEVEAKHLAARLRHTIAGELFGRVRWARQE